MSGSLLLGDCLIAAAFQTYSGNFDHKLRQTLLLDWFEILDALQIPYSLSNDSDIVNYLSNPSDLVKWRAFGLSSDDLSIQNAILLDRFDRYPLVIDPAGNPSSNHLSMFTSIAFIHTSVSAT